MRANRLGWVCLATFFGCLLIAHAVIFARNADVRESLNHNEPTFEDCANVSLYTKGMLVILVLMVVCAMWYLMYNCFPYSAFASGAAYHLMAFAILDTLIGSASFNIVGTYWLANSGACVAEAPSLYHLALGENVLFHLLFDGTVLWGTGVLCLVWTERRSERSAKHERLLAGDAAAVSSGAKHVPVLTHSPRSGGRRGAGGSSGGARSSLQPPLHGHHHSISVSGNGGGGSVSGGGGGYGRASDAAEQQRSPPMGIAGRGSVSTTGAPPRQASAYSAGGSSIPAGSGVSGYNTPGY